MPEDDLKVAIARIEEQLASIKSEVHDVKSSVVTKAEFEPVKRIVYGGAGCILFGVVVAMLKVLGVN